MQEITCSLTDLERNWIGLLLCQEKEEMDLKLRNQTSRMIELVSISRTIVDDPHPNIMSELERKLWKLTLSAPCEFYNVLWIEREMGIAYRKGVGRVAREDLERLKESGDIDLITTRVAQHTSCSVCSMSLSTSLCISDVASQLYAGMG